MAGGGAINKLWVANAGVRGQIFKTIFLQQFIVNNAEGKKSCCFQNKTLNIPEAESQTYCQNTTQHQLNITQVEAKHNYQT